MTRGRASRPSRRTAPSTALSASRLCRGRLASLLVGEGLDPFAQGLGIALDPIRLGFLLLLDVVEVVQVPLGRAEGELLGNQEVSRIAVGDVAHVPAASQLADVVKQDDF